jgi:hypothetical protein
MLEAQNVWDATMAHSIAARFQPTLDFSQSANSASKSSKKPLVLHVCGKFHCENHLVLSLLALLVQKYKY